MTSASPRIGTLKEKPLHASLKRYCAEPGDCFEVPVDGYVIDIVRGDLLVEIQTRGFSSMKRKLADLLAAGHRVRVVHPIAADRHIVRLDDDGTVLGRRRSPKHGRPIDVFAELVGIVDSLSHPGIELDLVMTLEDEYRVYRPGKAWRRNGWTVLERRLLGVAETIEIRSLGHLVAMLPEDLPEVFTTADLAEGLGCTRRLAQQMTYTLREAETIRVVGKRGNVLLYEVGGDLGVGPGQERRDEA